MTLDVRAWLRDNDLRATFNVHPLYLPAGVAGLLDELLQSRLVGG